MKNTRTGTSAYESEYIRVSEEMEQIQERKVKRKDRNLSKLMEYAEIFKVTKLLRNYMEVLL